MTMMQYYTRQMFLSSSSMKDMKDMEILSAAASADEDLTYWSWLKNQESSVWDLLSGDPLGGVDPADVLCNQKHKKSSIMPYVSITDLNNSDDSPYENKPKPAVEVGIQISF